MPSHPVLSEIRGAGAFTVTMPSRHNRHDSIRFPNVADVRNATGLPVAPVHSFIPIVSVVDEFPAVEGRSEDPRSQEPIPLITSFSWLALDDACIEESERGMVDAGLY